MDIQNLIVAAIIIAAVAYMLRKFVFRKKAADGDSPCPGCGKCGGSSGGSCH